MQKFALIGCITASLALAACSNAAEEPAADEAPAEEAVVEEVSLAADGGPSAGTYEVTLPDGTVWTYVANADGTYVTTSSTGETETGTWRQDGPNRWCDTETGGEEICRTETVDENGVYTSTSETDPTDSVVVVRVS